MPIWLQLLVNWKALRNQGFPGRQPTPGHWAEDDPHVADERRQGLPRSIHWPLIPHLAQHVDPHPWELVTVPVQVEQLRQGQHRSEA